MNHETEVLGEFGAQEFTEHLENFKHLFGPPSHVRRLALQVTDFNRHDLDTRVRITNGQPVLMQKVGSWQSKIKEEKNLELPRKAQFIADLLQTVRRLLPPENLQTNLMQLENYIFEQPGFELKLTQQTGLKQHFCFELEALNPDLDLYAKCKAWNLDPNMTKFTEKQWHEYNKTANLDWAKLSDEELLGLIDDYLKTT